MKVVRLSAFRTGLLWPHPHPPTPGNIIGTHFCLRVSQLQGHSAGGRIMAMKHSNDNIEIRTHDLPAYSAVPQATAAPRQQGRNTSKIKVTNLIRL